MLAKGFISFLLLPAAVLLFIPSVCLGTGSTGMWAKGGFQIEKDRPMDFVPGEILVKFKKGTTQSEISALNSYMQSQEFKHIDSINVRRIKLPPDLPVDEAVARFRNDSNVEYAEPNYIYQLAAMPNDPSFGQQWGLHNTGQQVNGLPGTAGADIDAPNAWDITTGSHDVIIAVIDSGVAYLHPEIQPNLWINTKEYGGLPGVDDDQNGYVDDIYGWDFFADDSDPTDYTPHGTHVAGIIAGIGNNGAGITGVNWKAKIMPLRAGGILIGINTSDAIDAITYAVGHGAKIINASWSGPNYSQPLYDAISHANDNGVLFIAAAGNGGDDSIGDNNDQVPSYPAGFNLPNIIAVAATDQDDNLTTFSNFGLLSVHVAAPGKNIMSTVPEIGVGASVPLFSETFDPYLSGWGTWGNNSPWSFVNGTGFGGSRCLEDSFAANYLNNTDSHVAFFGAGTPFTSLKDHVYALSFKLKADLEINKDFLYLVFSQNRNTSVNWEPLSGFSGTTGGVFNDVLTSHLTLLTELFPSFYFGFRLSSDSANTRDGVYIDNINLFRAPLVVDAFAYDYYNGSSMAAPHVAGVAGLVMAQNPTYTHLQVREAIFKGVEKIPSLIGKLAMEGRINAFKAVTYVEPPSGVTATAANAAVSLNWNANSESAVSGYSVSYGLTPLLGKQIAVGDVSTYTVSGLTNGSTYYFAVRAVADFPVAGLIYSAESEIITAAPVSPPSPPSGGGSGGGCFITTIFP